MLVSRKRWLVAAIALACSGLVPSAAGAAGAAGTAPRVAVVNVQAGVPDELTFPLSKFSLLAVGKVTFKVTNKGILTHDFKVCTKAVATSKANSCVGTGTKRLSPGQSATMSITFKTKGKYEFLCTVSGHASSGMKGLLGVGVKVAA